MKEEDNEKRVMAHKENTRYSKENKPNDNENCCVQGEGKSGKRNEEPQHETIESLFKESERKKGGKNSSKSSKIYLTAKSSKFKTSKDFNKKNPASVYMNELKRCAELNKKRNQTARFPLHKLKMSEVFQPEVVLPVKKSTKMLLEETHQKMINEMNNPKNPYSAFWSNQILEKRYNMEFGVNGFINGVPVISIHRKKAPSTLKRLKKESAAAEEVQEEATNENIKADVDLQFNTNQKNFFKVRKDIAEEALENEDDKDICKDTTATQTEIQYGLIYKYFEANSTKSNDGALH